jgi:N-acetylglutamate synthase-like GNAT family acetyltransferase
LFSFLSFNQGLTTDTTPTSYQVFPIHKRPEFIDQCIHLINSEWPRSRVARLWSLESSKDKLPTSLVLIKNEQLVLAHAKLSQIPADSESVFLESVVVSQQQRGKGYGKLIVKETEKYCREFLQLKSIVLSTVGQEMFYAKLGYENCEPISLFGSGSKNSSTKKTFMRKDL